MIEKYKTKSDINGNTYTIEIDHERRHFCTNYNPFSVSEYLTIGKRDRAKLIEALRAAGYTETTRITL